MLAVAVAALPLPGIRRAQRNFPSPIALSSLKEQPMADNKNANEKQPGEHPEGKFHYNPGNQAGKATEKVDKDDAKENDEPHRDRA